MVMKRSDMTYIITSLYASLAGIFYFGIMYFHITVLRYYPLENFWALGKTEGKISQGWYGMQLFAFAAAAIVTFIVYLTLKLSARDFELKPTMTKGIGIITSMIVVTCLVFIMLYQFEHWHII
jgi:hypothetical protein